MRPKNHDVGVLRMEVLRIFWISTILSTFNFIKHSSPRIKLNPLIRKTFVCSFFKSMCYFNCDVFVLSGGDSWIFHVRIFCHFWPTLHKIQEHYILQFHMNFLYEIGIELYKCYFAYEILFLDSKFWFFLYVFLNCG